MMTPTCGRCGSRAVAHINGVGRQCLMCGEEHAQEGRAAACVVEVDADDAQDQENAALMSVRAASKALTLPYKTLLRWGLTGELPATDWDPRQSRRGRLVRLVDVRALVNEKKLVECAECGKSTWREQLPKGKQRRFCPPPARCASLWHSRHRVRPGLHNGMGIHNS